MMKNILKDRRLAFSKTQAQIAEEAGISLRAYQQFESGANIPRADTANKLADLLHTSSKEIWGVRKAGG